MKKLKFILDSIVKSIEGVKITPSFKNYKNINKNQK